MKKFLALFIIVISLLGGENSQHDTRIGQAGPGVIEWSKDGGFIALGSWSGNGLWILDLSNPKPREIEIEGIRGRQIDSDGNKILAKTIREGSQQATAVDVLSGKIWSSPIGSNIGAPVAIEGGFCYTDNGILIRADANFHEISRFELPNLPQRIVAEARNIYYSGDDGLVRRFDIDTEILDEFPCEISLWNLSVHDGNIVTEGSDGYIWLYNGIWHRIAKGNDPCLNDLGFVFTQTETEGFKITSSRLMFYNGFTVKPLSSKGMFFGHPSISPDGVSIAFVDLSNGDLYLADFDGSSIFNDRIVCGGEVFDGDNPRNRPSEPAVSLDCPYIHQVYDTPDWFNGSWSCGPTSCMMAQAKYDILPHRDITCSWPYSHTSHWGWYIPNLYSFNGFTYDDWGECPSPNDSCQGAHGFICPTGGAWWYLMSDWLNQHFLSGVVDTSPSWSELTSEIDAGWVIVTSSTFLGSYGHITIIKGYNADHSYYSNDPYGNANTSPWLDYDGENVLYDWPGYDNGHHDPDIRGFIYSHGTGGSVPDTIVDDRSTGYRSYGSVAFWYEAAIGWESHMWWTYSTDATDTTNDTCYVTWTPVLPDRRFYEVYTYIPLNNAVASAKYRLYHDQGISTTTVRQESYYNEWVSLGTHAFEAGEGGRVYLGDGTGFSGEKIGFDAIKWSDRGALPPPDTLVELMSDGFRWGGPVKWRRIVDGGYSGKFYWTGSTNATDINYGIWRPNLPGDGDYEVFAYIVSTHATSNAIYRINHDSGESRVIINQALYSAEWVSLGTYSFCAMADPSVWLGDSTGTTSTEIGYDAIVWRQTGLTCEEKSLPHETELKIFPNPFNSACIIHGTDNASVYNLSGKLVTELRSEPNSYLHWDGLDTRGNPISNGIYFILDNTNKGFTQVILLK